MDALYPIVSLGETAEIVAELMQISREDQDAFALQSQRLGEHTRAVLEGLLDYTGVEVDDLAADGVVQIAD